MKCIEGRADMTHGGQSGFHHGFQMREAGWQVGRFGLGGLRIAAGLLIGRARRFNGTGKVIPEGALCVAYLKGETTIGEHGRCSRFHVLVAKTLVWVLAMMTPAAVSIVRCCVSYPGGGQQSCE